MEIKEIVSKQREYFYTKETYDVKFRKKVLLEIKNLLFKSTNNLNKKLQMKFKFTCKIKLIM